jgi:Flp pilus assembly protein TadG
VTSAGRDRGSTSLTTVLLTPVFVVIAFAGFQAALWSHVRAEARAAARDAAAQVARSGDQPDLVESAWEQALLRNSALKDPDMTIEPRGDIVVVTVRATAPGIIRGTTSEVEVTEALPIEGFRP